MLSHIYSYLSYLKEHIQLRYRYLVKNTRRHRRRRLKFSFLPGATNRWMRCYLWRLMCSCSSAQHTRKNQYKYYYITVRYHGYDSNLELYLRCSSEAADLSALLLVLLVCVTYASIAPLIILAGVGEPKSLEKSRESRLRRCFSPFDGSSSRCVTFTPRPETQSGSRFEVHVPRFDSGGAFWYLLWNQA